MNFVTAKLLLFMGEAEAFWCLDAICGEFFAETYTLDMAGSHVRTPRNRSVNALTSIDRDTCAQIDSLILEALCRGDASAVAEQHEPSGAGGGTPGADQLLNRHIARLTVLSGGLWFMQARRHRNRTALIWLPNS